VVTDEQLNASYVVPSVFDPQVPKAVAAAVASAAQADPTAATAPDPD
jgi:malate dehydrogenase (oxaloacetate-decarboxylating)